MDISVVIPVRDEVDSVATLAREIESAFAAAPQSWECVWVDDGSADGTRRVLEALHARDSRHQYVSLAGSSGQSAALAVGFQYATGRVVATLDGDLQNDPSELPRLIRHLDRGCVDMVTGIRVDRRDGWRRRVSSRIANAFRNSITGDRIRDVGCSLRAFYRECIADVPVFNGMHRFLPTLVRMHGFVVVEVPVGHRPRRFGRTKYGVHNRLWRGIADCLAVRWMRSRAVHPVVRATTFASMDQERKHLA
jgi:glycosyltransferase involved in cell wall biosynthesis